MDARFFEAWINRADHVVLGRRLHPFCLYDIAALEFIESPFLNLDKAERVTYDDLRLAVRICSEKPGAALEANFFQTSGIREIWDALCFRRLRKITSTEASFTYECDRFSAYLEDYYSTPFYCESDEEEPSLKLHWLLICATRCLRNTSFSEDYVWSMPVGKLTHYGAASALLDGASDDLVSPDEEAAMKEMGLV